MSTRVSLVDRVMVTVHIGVNPPDTKGTLTVRAGETPQGRAVRPVAVAQMRHPG